MEPSPASTRWWRRGCTAEERGGLALNANDAIKEIAAVLGCPRLSDEAEPDFNARVVKEMRERDESDDRMIETLLTIGRLVGCPFRPAGSMPFNASGFLRLISRISTAAVEGHRARGVGEEVKRAVEGRGKDATSATVS